MFPNVVQEQFDKTFGGASGFTGYHVAKLGQAVYHGLDGVEPPTLRQTDREVHTQVLPRCIRHRVRPQGSEGRLAGSLCSLARVAFPHTPIHISSYPRPEELSGQQLQRLGATRVASDGCVVDLAEQVEANFVQGRDVIVKSKSYGTPIK